LESLVSLFFSQSKRKEDSQLSTQSQSTTCSRTCSNCQVCPTQCRALNGISLGLNFDPLSVSGIRGGHQETASIPIQNTTMVTSHHQISLFCFSGVRALDGSMTDLLERDAFAAKHSINDIYSCSWGPEDLGETVDGPHTLAKVRN